jgi:hypothetical protein
MNELIYAFTKLLGKTEDELTPLIFEGEGEERKLKDGAIDQLIALEASKIAKIKDEYKADKESFFNEGYKKAQGETLTKIDREFETATGFKGTATDTLGRIMEYVETQKKSKHSGEVTPDVVKLHPVYRELEAARAADLAAAEQRLNEFQGQIVRKEKLSRVQQLALQQFEALNPVEFDDPAKRDNLRKVFLNDVLSYDDYQFNENGNIELVVHQGKRVEDELGNPTSFSNIVKKTADKYYQFRVQDPKGSAGNKTGQPMQPSTMPTDETARNAAIQKAYEAEGYEGLRKLKASWGQA